MTRREIVALVLTQNSIAKALSRQGLRASFIFLAAIISAMLIVPPSAFAQTDGMEMTLSPTSNRITLKASQVYNGKFVIVNTGKEPFNFKVYASPYQVKGEEYTPVFNRETSRTQIARWVSFPTTNYSLTPGKSATVQYVVKTPKDIPNGGQYAALFAETTQDASDAGQAVIARKRVGMLLYASAAGTTREQGTVEAPSISKWYHGAPLALTWKVKNTGNTDFIAEPSITIHDMRGKEVYASPSQELAVLPGTTRAINLQWTDAKTGIYTVKTTIKYLDKEVVREQRVLIMSPVIVFGIVTIVVVLVAYLLFALFRYLLQKAKA